MVISHLSEMLAEPRQESSYCAMTRQIFDYVENNLQNSNLTLNYIAEHCLYMNVDYVSKKFVKGDRTQIFGLSDGCKDSKGQKNI